MPSHSLFPRYSYPAHILLGVARDWLLLRHRSFRADSAACLAELIPPLKVSGREHIPSAGPCLLTFNHYFRPGYNAWWTTLAIASQLPMEAHFVMTDELTFPGKWYAPVGSRLSHWVLRRGAEVYGFTSMPPMPPREKDVAGRARSVREALSFADRAKDPVIGLAPEGGDMPGGRLADPPSGVGRFVFQLAGRGLKVIPVGVFEQAGCLWTGFGPAYALTVPKGISADERDRIVAKQVMENIAPLLPTHLRGEFQ